MQLISDRVQDVSRRLRAAGCRVTPQRLAILEAVLGMTNHPTAEEVYQRVRATFPMTSRATVYNTLAMLRELGEVREVRLSDDSSHYDLVNGPPHAHLVCAGCSAILDLDHLDPQTISEEVQSSTGYRVKQVHLTLIGECPSCQAQKELPQIDAA